MDKIVEKLIEKAYPEAVAESITSVQAIDTSVVDVLFNAKKPPLPEFFQKIVDDIKTMPDTLKFSDFAVVSIRGVDVLHLQYMLENYGKASKDYDKIKAECLEKYKSELDVLREYCKNNGLGIDISANLYHSIVDGWANSLDIKIWKLFDVIDVKANVRKLNATYEVDCNIDEKELNNE